VKNKLTRRPRQQPLQGSELRLPPEPDLGELERFHDPAYRDWLVDILCDIAGLADAKDPGPTTLLNVFNPPSRRVQ
jgi:hypothetical protein